MASRYALLLLSGTSAARAALNLDGTQAVEPAINRNDPSPIDSPNTYYQEQHDCPLPCFDYANTHSWITYTTVGRLDRCSEPMLLQFSVSRSLRDSPNTLIRSCTLPSNSPVASVNTTSPLGKPYATEMENPKLSEDLYDVSINYAPACAAEGLPVSDTLAVFTSTETAGEPVQSEIYQLLENMQLFFDEEDNCNEKFLFAKHKKTVAGLYIGAGLGKPTANSALDALATYFRDDDESAASISNRTAVELCDDERLSPRIFGVSVDTTGDLAAVQAAALGWSSGKCIKDFDEELQPDGSLAGVDIFDIAATDISSSNSTAIKPFHSRFQEKRHLRSKRNVSRLKPRNVCDYLVVEPGDGCASLASKCGLTGPEFMNFNPKPDLCSTLMPGDYVCCSAGDPYEPPEPEGTCDYLMVEPGDDCPSLATKCGITGDDFMSYNPQPSLCATLMPGDYVCCSPGDPYEPPGIDPPQPQPDGTCATHIIENGDTCHAIATRYGVTVDDLEDWNTGKTWAWTKCGDMLVGYNMCISPGRAALPPPQEGAQCGPMVPGTTPPPSGDYSLANLNPCPLKVCCSNWGFCGIFPDHCTTHEVEGGSPGAKPDDVQSTCVSNCGTDIVTEDSPPASFDRIGYYESWNLGRPCLWLNAEDANIDGSYTHMHWGFLDIDPQTWTLVITDPHDQWEGFKQLPNMKRVVSIGGWAYSTEPATYNILRQAIIDNRDLFATNIATFLDDEGLDGIDIDWEYPGAPDIEVGGQIIGQETDGADYLSFLTSLRGKVGPDKIVAIAAPASYWYLKAFPIDQIADVVDYIVYMTYDLHGQWDAGNPNAYDECDSGRCIRSHVNLTETMSALSMVTKAGVSTHKLFVGEASYGRSFHMAEPGCWGPMCDFTGSRTESNATPGRCTGTAGYLANAEIYEIISRRGFDEVIVFYDEGSNADVLLYDDNYVSFMTSHTKDLRRTMWEEMNFAGSIDWAVDLQEFSKLDVNAPFEREEDENGEVCTYGTSFNDDAADLCEFTCSFGYCPEPVCQCRARGPPRPLPRKQGADNVVSIDDFNFDMNRLCKFACQHGHCPPAVCTTPAFGPPTEVEEVGQGPEPDWDTINYYKDTTTGNSRSCWVYEDPQYNDLSICQRVCDPELMDGDGPTTNYGCVAWSPGLGDIPWQEVPGGLRRAGGKCECNNWLVNFFAETILEALPAIAQIGCYIAMSTFKLILDIGLSLFRPGQAISAGLDMMATTAQMINHLYDEDEDPVGAFEWWLWPCGGSDLVPDEVKQVFDILNLVTSGISYRTPSLPKGSGKKGDATNPHDSDRGPRPGDGNRVGKRKQPSCRIRKSEEHYIVGQSKNILRRQKCVGQFTMRNESILTSLIYATNAQPTQIRATCDKEYSQACYHYSSAIRNNPSWAAIQCPQEAAKPEYRFEAKAVRKWNEQRSGAGWLDPQFQPWVAKDPSKNSCQRDEFPPAYLLNEHSVAWINSGQDLPGGQLIRFIPHTHNAAGGRLWRGACFASITSELKVNEFQQLFVKDEENSWTSYRQSPTNRNIKLITEFGNGTVGVRPEFTIVEWGHSNNPVLFDGLRENECWPQAIVPNHAGFALLDYDPWNKNNELNHGYDYKQPK